MDDITLSKLYPEVFIRGKHFKNLEHWPFYSLKELSAASGLPVFTNQTGAKMIINWGRGGYGTVPNSVRLHLNKNPCVLKYDAAVKMIRIGACTPKAWKHIDRVDTKEFPIVMKPVDSYGGHGIVLIRNQRYFERINPKREVWFQGFIDKKREFRVYFWRNTPDTTHRVTMVEEKNQPEKEILTWNRKYCPSWVAVRNQSFKDFMARIVSPAADALNIDWGAADVTEDTSGNYWIIEINTRPSSTHPGEERGRYKNVGGGIWKHTGGSSPGSSSRMWARVWENFLRDEYAKY
jgi:hypothetical protein